MHQPGHEKLKGGEGGGEGGGGGGGGAVPLNDTVCVCV